MKRPTSSNRPNWRLIIIAVLLAAFFITWKNHDTRAKKEHAIAQVIEKQKEAREKALAEAKTFKEAEARNREAERAASNLRDQVKPPEPKPPVEIPADAVSESGSPDRINSSGKTAEPELPPEIANLNTKARDLVTSAAQKRSEQIAENARKLSWDLDLHLRTLPKSEQIDLLPQINRIKGLIENNRIPESILQSDEIDFSKRMEEVTSFAVTKQKQIDQGFISESAKIHGAYVRKISDAAKQAEAAGQKPLSNLLARTLDDATNLGDWLRKLGVDEAAQAETP
jgi:hypothetical protein